MTLTSFGFKGLRVKFLSPFSLTFVRRMAEKKHFFVNSQTGFLVAVP
jgi:hypothetical protein